jgi:hypothetical protein
MAEADVYVVRNGVLMRVPVEEQAAREQASYDAQFGTKGNPQRVRRDRDLARLAREAKKWD